MTMTDRGACEWFIWDLRRSNLIDRGQLDQVIGDFLKKQPGADPPALAQYLVRQNVLTQFQVDRVLEGKTQGLVLGPYTLMEALGSGSMGTVYRAQSKNDQQIYAVKVLPRRSMWNVRIARRQVRAFEQCHHPAVVPFSDVGTAGGMHYLAWPLVEGETLDKLVERQGKLSGALTARYALQTAQGLEVCHQKDLFHGLLKPSNLMVGTDQQVRILDFGIGALLAEVEGESLVDTMSTSNTLTSGLDCASPESILEPSNRTPAGDQYSLGCVLYFCLTGRYPFEGSPVEKMVGHQAKQPPSLKDFNPDVPDALLEVVEQLMQKEPGSRYGTISEVVRALTPLANLPLPATRSSQRPGSFPGTNGSTARRDSQWNSPSPAPRESHGNTAAPARPAAPPVSLPTRETTHHAPPAAAFVRTAPNPAPLPQAIPREEFASPAPSPLTLGSVGLSALALLLGALGYLAWMSIHH